MSLRLLVTIVISLVVLGAAAPAVLGTATELGATQSPPPPSCPADPCQAVSRTTGFQAKIGDVKDPMVVPNDGRVVAFSIALGAPNPEQVKFFQDNLGGESRARLTVLDRDGRSYRVRGQSEDFDLTPYFGKTAQFALDRTIPVTKGQVVALTIPTWAPALAVGLDRKDGWRASRGKDECDDTKGQSAQDMRDSARYACLYRTARLTYSATLITTP